MKKNVIMLIMCLLSIGVMAQVQVYPLGNIPEKGVKYTAAVTYALPTTTLKVTVSVSKVQEVRGYFADYAESLLGMTNIIQQNRTRYTLNSVNVEPMRTADTSECYRAYTSNSAIAEAWNTLQATPAFPDMSLGVYQTHTADLPDFFKNYADVSYTQQSEAFVDTRIIDGVVTQVPASHTRTVSKSYESKAREAADAIMKSRKDQYSLAAGEQETPYSGEALQTMLSELKSWENNYLSLFSGVSVYDTIVYVFYVTPDKGLSETPAFYFDSEKGFAQEKGTASSAYSLSFSPFYNMIREVVMQYPVRGFITRTEMPVRVSLTHNGQSLHDFGVMDMYQAGATKIIPASTSKSVDMNAIGVVF